MADDTDNFLSRWSRRKAEVRSGAAVAEAAAPVEAPAQALLAASPPTLPLATPAAAQAEVAPTQPDPANPTNTPAPPPPTMADVALLTRDADYTRYLGGNVAPEVKNAALKHLFTDPHFNVMDGLDIYIGDYNTPDPLPPGMLRQMVQSQMLGLFDEEVAAEAEATAATPLAPTGTDPDAAVPTPIADPTPLAADENPDLQLQPDDVAGRLGPEAGAGPHTGRPD